MSFILDALRKSEHARQKQTGPGFAEVPVMVARPRTNVWATAAVALLVVNLLAVGVLLLRRAGNENRAAPVTATTTAPSPDVATDSAAASASEDAPAVTAPGSAGPTLAPPADVTEGVAPPRPRASDSGRNPLADEVAGGVPGVEPSLAAAAASVPDGPPAVTRQPGAPVRRGSVVYAPIPEASDAPYASPTAASAGETAPRAAAGLPSADEMTARGGLPELHLDLHVYSTVPQQRFIFVNSRKYREGDALQEGPVVEQITSQGAVLSYRGSRFQLSND
ncbi:MAG TPA: general secretion pathway protein GspB [Steroidobacteraceae bacterium]|nr:general secretion pathway protein GspB [Steroidobacteraceae bacterium]